MTHPLFRDDPYLREARATVLAHTEEGGIVLDASLFYPTGGGQPGDGGILHWGDQRCKIATTIKGDGQATVLVPETAGVLPSVGQRVGMELDWRRRFGHMRIHTALHLLSVVVPFGVTGGAIGTEKGRLDFDMAAAPEDKDAIAAEMNRLIASDAAVSAHWITDAELDAQPELVKTMKVKPPRGSGQVRLVRIGTEDNQIDLQPCGGTHVQRLSEIGVIRLGKTEKKGRMNRRIYMHLHG
ncbi:MAG: alanyl-tRNA editing protein [Pseudomonadota bacterium]